GAPGGGGAGGETAAGVEGGEGRDVAGRAACVAPAQVSRESLRDSEGGGHVHVEHGAPALDRKIGYQLPGAVDACVVAEEVDVPEALDRGGDDLVGRVLGCDVAD